jgi:membrane-bound serine protease (ClpP class)
MEKRKTIYFCLILSLLLLFPAMRNTAAQTGNDQETSTVYIIPIHGDIEPSLVIFLRRSIETARGGGAEFIIFDIDTFGGRVDSALQITTLIGSLEEITTIAYVNVRPEGTGVSWSAGALISFACNRIYMAPGTSIGAAAPVFQSPEGGMEMAPEKTVSAVRTQMAAIAEKNGYPIGVALAMVDSETVLIEAYKDDTLLVVTEEEFGELQRTAEEGVTIERGKTISAEGKLLSLTAGQMEAYGISSGTYSNTDALISSLGADPRDTSRLSMNAADEAVAVLTSTGVSSLLILVGLIALFMEITSPGFGIPGTVAILAFAVIFISNFLLGAVGSLELLLFIVGIGLLIVELFIIPGFGAAGISGIILIGLSLILSMQDFIIPEFEWEWREFHKNILMVTANIVGAFIVFLIFASLFKRVSFFRRLTLEASQLSTEGYTVQDKSREPDYLGREGTAVTTLRPAGKAEFGDELLTVQTDGDFVPAGSRVKIIEVNGNRYRVRKL